MAQRPRGLASFLRLEDRCTPAQFVPNQVVVGFQPGAEPSGLAAVRGTAGVVETKALGFDIYRVTVQPGMTVPTAVSALSALPGVRFAEPDYLLEKEFVPNDPQFSQQWALQNTGQTGGTAGADINAVRGWDVNRGTRQTVLAVLEAVDYTHPDLAPNMWRNPGEVAGNGIDDDANGYVDDIHGIDTESGDSDPMPAAGDTHGTHVAGIAAAAGNNGVGISGVATNTRIMSIKMAGLSSIVEGFRYAIANGARVMNASWTFIDIPRPAAFETVVVEAKRAGVILVCSAGNQTRDNDAHDRWPSNFIDLHDNVVPVAALDHTDQLAGFSNWGRQKVPLGAPGVDVLSTIPGGGYQLSSGTSMSSPVVAGAVTLAYDQAPDSAYADVVQSLYRTVTPIPSLSGRTSTGGKLNLYGFLASLGGNVFATGAGEGGGPHVKVYRANGVPVTGFMAYDANFTGGVRVATGDVTGDNFADIITVAGPGGGPHVKVFDGRTFALVHSFFAFESQFRGGLTVAAGDVNGDGRAEIIVGADKGGGPRVAVFSRTPTGTLARMSDFFAYDIRFSGGVRVAAGVFTAGSKQADLITTPGGGGGPHLRRYSAASVAAGRPTVAAQIMVGDPTNTSGLWVAAGDLTGDGVADITTGSGSGTPTVTLLDGRNLSIINAFRSPTTGEAPGLTNPFSATQVTGVVPPTTINGLLAPATPPTGLTSTNPLVRPAARTGYMFGVRVAVQDVDGDKKPDIILAGGPTDAPLVTLLNGQTYATIGSYLAYDPAFFGGVFVGGVGA